MNKKNITFLRENRPMVYSLNRMNSCILSEGYYRNIHFVVVNNYGHNLSAYINVEKDDKYDSYEDYPVFPHGGLTFGSRSGDKFLPDKGENRIWLGWDYGHLGDYTSLCTNPNYIKWNTEDVINEAVEVIDEYLYNKED